MSRILTYDLFLSTNINVRAEIIKYVNNIPIPESFKEIITNPSFFDSNPSFYVDYPFLFLDKNSHEDVVVRIAIAGYLYYLSAIYIDRILDNDISIIDYYSVVNICQEETVRLISSIFNLDSDFWRLWYLRKSEYMNAFLIDTEKQDTIKTYEDFINHADAKSALAKLAIDALFKLQLIDESEYDDCLILHKYFYGAFQILDDLSDIREDYRNNQFNIAVWRLKQFVSEGRFDVDVFSDEHSVYKYIHISGISVELCELAERYINRALSISKIRDFSYFNNQLLILNNEVVKKRLTIQGYIKTLESFCRSYFLDENKQIFNPVNSALDYIQHMQSIDGHWEEISNNAGVSDIWATGFIAFFLSLIPDANLQICQMIDSAANFLSISKHDSGWGYNSSWISDNDSINYVLLTFFSSIHYRHLVDVNLLHFDHQIGAVSTYSNYSELLCSLSGSRSVFSQGVNGWCMPQPCVSAVTLYLISQCGGYETQTERLILYFVNILTENKPLSYWWIYDVYSLFFLLKASAILKNNKLNNLLLDKLDFEISLYSKDRHEETPLYLGLTALCIMSSCTTFNKYKKELDQIIIKLLDIQNSDGSWPSSSAMCIPSPSCIAPQNSVEWPISSTGVEIRALEYNRLFSTVISCVAIKQYEFSY